MSRTGSNSNSLFSTSVAVPAVTRSCLSSPPPAPSPSLLCEFSALTLDVFTQWKYFTQMLSHGAQALGTCSSYCCWMIATDCHCCHLRYLSSSSHSEWGSTALLQQEIQWPNAAGFTCPQGYVCGVRKMYMMRRGEEKASGGVSWAIWCVGQLYCLWVIIGWFCSFLSRRKVL